MKKILVTGGTGYIGSHTVVELQQAGFEVIIIDNLSNSLLDVLDNIEKITGIRPKFYEIDLVHAEACNDFFEREKNIDGVIHFAASKAVGESVQMPLFYYKNNLVSLINILENMKKHDIRNFVFSSSCTVYGQPKKLPATEHSPLQQATSPYGNTKQISEEILNDIQSVSNLKIISLRYFNPIGAHESTLIGELPFGVPNNLMPFITQTAAGIREKLSVFGNDYDTPDGTCIRDYIHVVDLAKSHVVAMNRLLENKQKSKIEFFNIATGQGYSVLDVIKSFEKVSGLTLDYEIVGRRAGDVEQIWADPSLANEELGWKAERNLDEMTASSWAWQKTLHY